MSMKKSSKFVILNAVNDMLVSHNGQSQMALWLFSLLLICSVCQQQVNKKPLISNFIIYNNNARYIKQRCILNNILKMSSNHYHAKGKFSSTQSSFCILND